MKHVILLIFVGILAACSASPDNGNIQIRPKTSSYNGLDSGHKTVSKSESEMSPLEMHMAARNKVNPNYDPESQKQTEIKLAKMEDDLNTVQSQFKGIKDTLPRETITTTQIITNAPAQNDANPSVNAAIKNVRTGERENATRVVFDMDADSPYSYSIDNDQNVLLVTFAQSHFDTAEHGILRGKMVEGYAAKHTDDGAMLIAIKLPRPASITQASALGQNEAGLHRVFFDIAPL